MSHMRVVWVDGIPQATVSAAEAPWRTFGDGGTAGRRAPGVLELAGRDDASGSRSV